MSTDRLFASEVRAGDLYLLRGLVRFYELARELRLVNTVWENVFSSVDFPDATYRINDNDSGTKGHCVSGPRLQALSTQYTAIQTACKNRITDLGYSLSIDGRYFKALTTSLKEHVEWLGLIAPPHVAISWVDGQIYIVDEYLERYETIERNIKLVSQHLRLVGQSFKPLKYNTKYKTKKVKDKTLVKDTVMQHKVDPIESMEAFIARKKSSNKVASEKEDFKTPKQGSISKPSTNKPKKSGKKNQLSSSLTKEEKKLLLSLLHR